MWGWTEEDRRQLTEDRSQKEWSGTHDAAQGGEVDGGGALKFCRHPFSRAIVVSFAWVLAAACSRERECRQRCLKFGIEPQSQECTTLCTRSCEELERTFGINEARCRAIQRGEERAP